VKESKKEVIIGGGGPAGSLTALHLACMGFGNCVVDLEGESRIKITTTNSLVPQVTSGLITGMAGALEGQPVGVTWEARPKTTMYTLELQSTT
jgi:flavin-dependent dehydrogenase